MADNSSSLIREIETLRAKRQAIDREMASKIRDLNAFVKSLDYQLIPRGQVVPLAEKPHDGRRLGGKGRTQYKCRHCPRVFIHAGHLGRHLTTIHKELSKAQRQGKALCKSCNKTFNGPHGLVMHEVLRHGRRKAMKMTVPRKEA